MVELFIKVVPLNDLVDFAFEWFLFVIFICLNFELFSKKKVRRGKRNNLPDIVGEVEEGSFFVVFFEVGFEFKNLTVQTFEDVVKIVEPSNSTGVLEMWEIFPCWINL